MWFNDDKPSRLFSKDRYGHLTVQALAAVLNYPRLDLQQDCPQGMSMYGGIACCDMRDCEVFRSVTESQVKLLIAGLTLRTRTTLSCAHCNAILDCALEVADPKHLELLVEQAKMMGDPWRTY